MRVQWLRAGATVLMLGLVAVLGASPDPGKPARSQAHSPVELDGEPSEVLADAGSVAVATDGGCVPIGGFNVVFPSQSPQRYRGNKFRIGPYDDTVLTEIKFELRINAGVQVALLFSVHELDPVSGTYTRALPQDIQVIASGTGAAKYYSTADQGTHMSLALERDAEYAIGVAWNSTAVSYGRDNVDLSDGLPFLHGEVVAHLAANVAPLPPGPIDEFALAPATLGAYSMQLCFDPVPGACCSAAFAPDSCEDRMESDCVEGALQYFSGQRTSCATGAADCVFGACCDDCGQCLPTAQDRPTPIACKRAGGTWAGEGVECLTGVCNRVTGACCTDDGACHPDRCPAECDALGGAYLGDGTECVPNFCAGACCKSGLGCRDITRNACGIALGIFKGEGTTCLALPPNLECGGACCHNTFGPTTCAVVTKRSDCNALGNGTYLGDTSVCPTTEVCGTAITGRGACCVSGGSCVMSVLSADGDEVCPAVSFIPTRSSCAGVQCETCCTGADCLQTPEATCGGNVLTVETCGFNPCDEPRGACCQLNSCEDDVLQGECEAAGGRFEKEKTCGEVCPPPPPLLGACCRPNGTCSDLVTVSECTNFGGSFRSGQVCGNVNPPCPSFGACCSPVGACRLEASDVCTSTGGFFEESGTLCGTSCETGACCVGENCLKLVEAACTFGQGIYRGDGTACDATVACGTTPGACCLGIECQADMLPQDCVDAGGVFRGGGSICEGECVAGACCLPSGTCEPRLDTECDSLGGAYAGDESECATAGACGACCQVGGGCTQAFEGACPPETGTFMGGGTGCAPNPCLSILSSSPTDCSVDPAQPSEPDSSSPSGLSAVAITFDADASGATVADFAVTEVPDTISTPTVTGVVPDGVDNRILTVELSAVINPARWTCISYVPSGQSTCVGFLPGDIDGDNTVGFGDVQLLLDCLSGTATCEPGQCDVDRSGLCTATDLVRLADLLNGGDQYDPFLGDQFPVACPNAP